jgi:hypothetical protein
VVVTLTLAVLLITLALLVAPLTLAVLLITLALLVVLLTLAALQEHNKIKIMAPVELGALEIGKIIVVITQQEDKLVVSEVCGKFQNNVLGKSL